MAKSHHKDPLILFLSLFIYLSIPPLCLPPSSPLLPSPSSPRLDDSQQGSTSDKLTVKWLHSFPPPRPPAYILFPLHLPPSHKIFSLHFDKEMSLEIFFFCLMNPCIISHHYKWHKWRHLKLPGQSLPTNDLLPLPADPPRPDLCRTSSVSKLT